MFVDIAIIGLLAQMIFLAGMNKFVLAVTGEPMLGFQVPLTAL
jgi:hypothetical protein